jgi:hypothetical protein
MTANQIAYWNYVESNRHNVATENIGYQGVAYNYANLQEVNRHNLASETLTGQGILATLRGQDINALVTTRGQDVSAAVTERGQDINAYTTQRGQTLTLAASLYNTYQNAMNVQYSANLQLLGTGIQTAGNVVGSLIKAFS